MNSLLKGLGGAITAVGAVGGAPLFAHSQGYSSGQKQKSVDEKVQTKTPEKKERESDESTKKNISFSNIAKYKATSAAEQNSPAYSDAKLSEYAEIYLLLSWCAHEGGYTTCWKDDAKSLGDITARTTSKEFLEWYLRQQD